MSSNELELGRSVGPEASFNILSRRTINKWALGLGAAAITGLTKEFAYPVVDEAIDKFNSQGDDYGNGDFLNAVGARPIDDACLRDLLSDAPDTPLGDVEQVNRERQANPANLAEFFIRPDKPGPVHLSINGIERANVSQAVLLATVDETDQFLLPVVAGPNQEKPSTIQLGMLDDTEHRVDISLITSHSSIEPEEITASFARGEPDTIRSFIDLHQPDIYLKDYGNIPHNIPLRSFVFVYETDEELALVYWTMCLGEDKTYYFFGTSVEELLRTKNRPVDDDWNVEALVNKKDGHLLQVNIAEPYHRRVPYAVDPTYTSHLPLREASENNNVRPVRDSSVLLLPKFRPRPQPYVHDDRWTVLYSAGKDTAALSLLEHSKRGDIDLNDPEILRYIGAAGIDMASLTD